MSVLPTGRRRTAVAVAAAVGLTAGVAALVPANAAPPAQAGKPTQDVTVTNGPTNPVPVAATQSGPWEVGITGTPTVAIAGTPSVTVANANPLPVSGSVKVTNTDPIPVRAATAPASKSYGIPVQHLGAGATYTFTDARYAMDASLLTMWSRSLVKFDFSGPAPWSVVTDVPQVVPLAQPLTVGPAVTVTCLETTRGCDFQFWLTGS
jgi:hypothetical protein